MTTKLRRGVIHCILAGVGKLPLEMRLALTRSRLIALPRRIFRRLANPGQQQHLRIQGGPAKGMRMSLDLATERTFAIGTYEPFVTQTLEAKVRPGMVAFDIGANIGYFSLVLAKLVGKDGKVYAFEPLPSNLQRLCDHINQNNLIQIKPSEIAVSENSGEATFYYWPQSNILGSIISSEGFSSDHGPAQELIVKTQSIDEIAVQEGLGRLDIVKIDAEGAEVNILRGMTNTLRQMRPTIICEFHTPELAGKGAKLLNQYGYVLYDIKQEPNTPLEITKFVPYRTTLLALPPAIEFPRTQN